MRFWRLPLSFDAASMAREAAALPADAWSSHFNADYHDGGWSGIALRAPAGDAARLYPDPNAGQPYLDTPLRSACPVVDAALREFGSSLRSARLLKLAPGGCIREHRDYGLSMENGEARLHVPISSEAGVEFYLDGQLMPMEPGECWYLDLDRPHRVQNLGHSDRVHLVLDCIADDWLAAQVPCAEEHERQVALLQQRAAAVDSAQGRLERFLGVVLADAALLDAVAAEDDPARLVQQVVDQGRRRGYAFTPEDVRAAMNASRREWIERWVVR